MSPAPSIYRFGAKWLTIVSSIALVGCFYLSSQLSIAPLAFLTLSLSTVAFTLYSLVSILVKKRFKHIGSLMVGFLALGIISLDPLEYIIEKTRSPIVLAAYCEHTVSGHSLFLRENGRFMHITPRLLTPTKKEHGTYTLRNDTLTLHFEKSPSIHMAHIYTLERKVLKALPNTSSHLHSFRIDKNDLE